MKKISLNPEFKRRITVLIMLVIIIAGAVGFSVTSVENGEPAYDSEPVHMDLIKAYMQSEYTAAFSPYYDMTYVKELADYKEQFNEKTNAVTARFVMKAAYKNYYRDPDTVPYIIEAKNSGNTEKYKKLYDEYNAERETTFTLKFKGDVKNDTVVCRKLYSSDDNGDWHKLKNGLNDYIITEK